MLTTSKINEYKNMDLSLDRIKQFLSKLNIDYNKINYIHIAGTNGKGTTAKLLSDIFINAGYKTGLYTSPHLIKINERIKINSLDISDRALNNLDKKYLKLSKQYKLTYFEYVTALAFIYFVKNNVDICILETGLGGRFDATNIITPLVSIITTVGLDHTEVLGSTLSKIAYEKAGIIKQNVPVVCGNMPNVAFNVIKKVAKKQNSKVYKFCDDFSAENLGYNWKRLTQKVSYKGLNINKQFVYSLLGNSQVYNVAVVLCCCEILKGKFSKLNFNNIVKLLKQVKFLARFDVRKYKKNTIVVDGAHNVQAIENFVDLFNSSVYTKTNSKLIFAMVQEKDYRKVVKKISSCFSKVFLVKIDNERAIKQEVLKKEFNKYIKDVEIKELNEIFNGVQKNDTIFCLGSFFLAGKIINYIKENKNG